MPAVTKVKTPPDVIVHTPVVEEVNVVVRPDVTLAVSVGLVPKFCAPGLENVIVCVAFGVTEPLAVDALPVPTELVAVTVNV